MTENDFLTLVRRWQESGTWQTVQALNTEANGFKCQAHKLGADARFILDRGDVATAGELKAESEHLRNCAANVLRQRSELAGEFMQIENWVREHRPELLEHVPTAEFSGDCSDKIRELKRLEGRLREKNANCGAPLFKKDPPFGPRVSIEVQNAVNTFMAEWNPTLNKDQWCDEYRKKVKRPDWKLRKILYDYLTFHDS